MGIGAFLPLIGKVLDLVFPNPKDAAEAKLRAAELAQKGELAFLDADVKLALGQMEINREEAKDPSLFKSGWRPFAGWTCVIVGLCYPALRVLLPWVLQVAGVQNVPQLPALDSGEIMAMLFGLLGLGGMRSAERLKGKA